MTSRITPAKKCRNALTRFCNEADGMKYAGGYARRSGEGSDVESVISSQLSFAQAASLLGTMLGKYAEAHDWSAAQLLGFLFGATAERDAVLGELHPEADE